MAERFRPVSAIFIIWGSFHLSPALADDTSSDADRPIVDLYKSGKLLDKREYKAVRAAFGIFKVRIALA